ncbi:uncharacterized protein HI_0933 [Rubritalea halochordaticola]|uniref:Uncharacterized protein HI_0933 n=1 Tax=Rubritalea halochordaticola TaxID=714537 RepID=A0ABP9UU55_9BACT
MYDLIVIGGGAAGFFGAITAAEHGANKVLILEKTANLLGKVKISGGGRCNVTHHCFEARELAKHYPRGDKSLIGPLSRWGAQDTVNWFQSRGVELKTEADGRMFPITDNSQTVIDCLISSAKKAGVQIQTSHGVNSIERIEDHHGSSHFTLLTEKGETLLSRSILLATGGTRLAAGAKLAESLGHTLAPPVPSLFTFKITHPLLRDLQGISVSQTKVQIETTKLTSSGPLLITHWGVSGPGILRLSAWGARTLAEMNYQFTLRVNWLPDVDVNSEIQQLRTTWGKRQLTTRSPFEALSKRLWNRFLEVAEIPETQTWSQLSKQHARNLLTLLTESRFNVDGKSLNKDEFVTAGGVLLKDIKLKTMESKLCPGLYFAGEVMDVDGITGGFNFQNAWTTGRHAGLAIAENA